MVDTKHTKQDEHEDTDVEITDEPAAPEETDTIETEATAQQKIKTLQEKAKAAESAKAEALEELSRGRADYLNARKRIEEDASNARLRDKRAFIESLLPLCDSFDQAMQNQDVWQQVDEQWRKGVEGIHGQLQQILQHYQVERDRPVAEPFDPKRHEAISEQPVTEESKHNTIVEVTQAGYHFADDSSTLIRPARVIVGAYQDTENTDTTNDS